MKYLLALLTIAALLSCEKHIGCGCINIDTHVDITVVDKNGNDLLNPKNQNAFKASEIKLLFEENGQLKQDFTGNLDYPKHFNIYTEDSAQFTMRLFPSKEVSYIKWNEADTDTLQCEIKKTSNSQICTKVWYNSKLVYDVNDQTGYGRFFKVVK